MNSAAHNIIVLNHNRQERVNACQTCGRRSLCPAANDLAAGRESGSQPVQRIIQSGKAVYETGDKFDGIYIVRSGFLKSYTIDPDGVMQVTGFHLPGELFGMDGIESGSYGDHVEALDTTSVCKIPLALFSGTRSNAHGAATDASPAAEHTMLALVKLMSRTISRDRSMFYTLGKMSARRRIGAFLQDLSQRMAKSGYCGSEFTLCMSRTDIANYLCLALETISRLFTQLQSEGLIAIDRRKLKLVDMEALVHDEPRQERIRKAG
jgi:CRP/FNR family transcriptional regulator